MHVLKRTRLLTLLLVLLAILAPGVASATPEIRLWLWVNQENVARGTVLEYEVFVSNRGTSGTERLEVTIPLQRRTMQVLTVRFDDKASWVSAISEDAITMMFGKVASNGSKRAWVVFRIKDDAPSGTITARAEARWSGGGDIRVRSDDTAFYVGTAAPISGPAANVTPASGSAGTLLTFAAQRLYPEETLFTWVNAPDGKVLVTDLTGRTAKDGSAQLRYKTDGLAPGDYTMVIFSQVSKVTLVVPFRIT